MIKLTTGEISEAVADYFACDTGSFDRWLESHDANVRAEVMEDVMHDRVADLTPAELIQAAFEAAFPVPEGRDVPAGVTIIARWKNGEMRANATGSTAQTAVTNDHAEVRTLDSLPPLIPDDCNAVWAGNEWLPDDVRVLWVRESDVFWRHIVTQAEAQKWCDGTLAFDVLTAVSDELINPVPVPSEGEATK